MSAATFTESSPFLRMSLGWRLFLIVFLLAYQWLFPTIAALNDTDANELFIPRVTLQLLYVLLLCLPLIFYRREYGFLHPLILPTLYSTGKLIAMFPAALVSPLRLPMYDFGVSSTSPALSINHLSYDALALARLEYLAIQVLALVCYYAGYFFFTKARGDWVRFHPPRNLGPICFAATMFCVVVSAVFVQVEGGGLSSYLVAMRNGRHGTLAGSGHFLEIAQFAVMPALVWYAYKRRMGFNPWWILAVVAGSVGAIVTTGSRSDLILPLLLLVLLWWRKAGRVLVVPALALAVVGTLVIGIFGSIRQDYKSQTVNTSVLDPSTFSQSVDRAQAEFEKRDATESDFAAFVGAGQNELLWGRSYIGPATFFVPRALWPDKPFNGGAYNQSVNFAGNSVDNYKSEKTHGIPMGPVSEAYWNFSVPGVILVFFLLGMFFRSLSAFVWRHPTEPGAILAAVWITLNLVGTSLSFVVTARDIILLAILYYALGIWRPSLFAHRARRSHEHAGRPILARRSG